MNYHTLFFTLIPAVIGSILVLFLLFYLIKKPSLMLFYFFIFFLISVFQLIGTLLTSFLLRVKDPYSIQYLWHVSLIFSRLRYIFLILFTSSLYRYKATSILTLIMITLTGIGIISPLFIYSIIPNLMEMAVLSYVFCYWLITYLLKTKILLSFRREKLLRALLVCSGFFLIGILLDLLKEIPQISAYISILLIDFYPLYILSIGSVVVVWAFKDLHNPISILQPGSRDDLILQRLPVTLREKEVISLILKGESNTSIADKLFMGTSKNSHPRVLTFIFAHKGTYRRKLCFFNAIKYESLFAVSYCPE